MTINPDALRADEINRLSKIYADATGYYVEFHSGLSSPSADKIREGIAAVLAALPPAAGEAEPAASPSLMSWAISVADMVDDWVTNGEVAGTDWRSGLKDIIYMRLKRLAAPPAANVRIEMVECVQLVGADPTVPADPLWRVLIGPDGEERCFDFETEREAINLRDAIFAIGTPAPDAVREAVMAERASAVQTLQDLRPKENPVEWSLWETHRDKALSDGILAIRARSAP